MLNHISVRQMETMETKERLDRLYSKLDAILMHQKQLVRMVSSGLSVSDEAIHPWKELFSTSTESFQSSVGVDSLNKDETDDDDTITEGITFTVKSTKTNSDDRNKFEVDSKMRRPNPASTLRQGNKLRQNAEDNTTESEAMSQSVDVEQIQTEFVTSPNVNKWQIDSI